jgi:hypothetical protein
MRGAEYCKTETVLKYALENLSFEVRVRGRGAALTACPQKDPMMVRY